MDNDLKKKLELVKKENIFPITGKIFSKPYNWGGTHLIPETLGFIPEPGTPYAEYWITTHHKAPAQLLLSDGSTLALEEAINTNQVRVLGKDVAQKYGDLPFLFKLLDAEEMLSVQLHPTKKQAEIGFEEENKKGIPLTDDKRTYKDNNQKFEICVALGDFWLLNSFMPKDKLKKSLSEVKVLNFLLPLFSDGDYKKLYTHVMVDMTDEEVNEMLETLAKRIIPLYEANRLEKENPDYWAAKAMKYMDMLNGNFDRGLFSIYFLNMLHLKKGEAAKQGSGVLHAYLHGPIIEVMTTSDNVVRAGITSKYIDIDALMKLTNFEGAEPTIILGKKDTEREEENYHFLTDIFTVSKILLEKDKPYKNKSYSAEILIGLEGVATISAYGKTLQLGKGNSIIVFADTEYEITGNENDTVYKTSVPASE